MVAGSDKRRAITGGGSRLSTTWHHYHPKWGMTALNRNLSQHTPCPLANLWTNKRVAPLCRCCEYRAVSVAWWRVWPRMVGGGWWGMLSRRLATVIPGKTCHRRAFSGGDSFETPARGSVEQAASGQLCGFAYVASSHPTVSTIDDLFIYVILQAFAIRGICTYELVIVMRWQLYL